MENPEQMSIVIIGHVDHGKSTVIGRLLADTDSLPQGKLDQVRKKCEANSRPFEYAFLLDALKDEQAQGITIDTARCFFKTEKRQYIVIDAPGHIEFLKNMITGAAHAEAAVLVIDALEGVKENSRRHGYLASFLGIRQIVVLINKIDLVNYDRNVFEKTAREFKDYLAGINVEPVCFIPVSAINGENLVFRSPNMPWYSGATLLETMDNLEKDAVPGGKPFRMPLQDIYKFTEEGDDRRIFAGTVISGSLSAGDEVVFHPSGKRSRVRSIEAFSSPPQNTVSAGSAAGFTVDTQIYVRPGEVVCRAGELPPETGTQFKASLFWLGRNPLIMNKRYKLKIGTFKTAVYLKRVLKVIDATDLSAEENKTQVDYHDVAECVFETVKPLAFDPADLVEETGRFVIVDAYEIAGGGIIRESVHEGKSVLTEHVRKREFGWIKGRVTQARRSEALGHNPKFMVITGSDAEKIHEVASLLEEALFTEGRSAYYLGISNLDTGLNFDFAAPDDREEQLRRMGEIARIFTDAGFILISTVLDLDPHELKTLKVLNEPNDVLVLSVGEMEISDLDDVIVIGHEDVTADILTEIRNILHRNSILPEYNL